MPIYQSEISLAEHVSLLTLCFRVELDGVVFVERQIGVYRVYGEHGRLCFLCSKSFCVLLGECTLSVYWQWDD